MFINFIGKYNDLHEMHITHNKRHYCDSDKHKELMARCAKQKYMVITRTIITITIIIIMII